MQLHYADTDPQIPSLCGTKLHPAPGPPPEPEPEVAAPVALPDFGQLDLDADMQFAILADAAAMAGIAVGG